MKALLKASLLLGLILGLATEVYAGPRTKLLTTALEEGESTWVGRLTNLLQNFV